MTRPNAILLAALAIALPLSLLAGQVWIDPFGPPVPNATAILMELRLPRAVLAIAIGAGLGAAGAAMQGYLRNPLADPGLFGIAPMAALGAVASFWLTPLLPAAIAPWSLPLLALLMRQRPPAAVAGAAPTRLASDAAPAMTANHGAAR